MIPIAAEEAQKMKTPDAGALIDELLDDYYPPLFLLINQLHFMLETAAPARTRDRLMPLQNRMSEEMEALYQKEKKVLFPLLLRLEADGDTSENCQPFKNVKHHFTQLVSVIQQYKHALRDTERPQLPDMDAEKILLELEQRLIQLQLHKERFLFKPFRSCSGNCQSIES